MNVKIFLIVFSAILLSHNIIADNKNVKSVNDLDGIEKVTSQQLIPDKIAKYLIQIRNLNQSKIYFSLSENLNKWTLDSVAALGKNQYVIRTDSIFFQIVTSNVPLRYKLYPATNYYIRFNTVTNKYELYIDVVPKSID